VKKDVGDGIVKHKSIQIILLITFILLLTACSKKAPEKESQEPEVKEPEQSEQAQEKNV